MFQDESVEVSGLVIEHNTTITYKVSNPHFTGLSGTLTVYEGRHYTPEAIEKYYETHPRTSLSTYYLRDGYDYDNSPSISIPIYVKGRSSVVQTFDINDFHPTRCVFTKDDGTEVILRDEYGSE